MERSPRPKKVAIVEEIKERFDASSAVLLTEYRGLKVSELEVLRRRLKDSGGEYKIFKNTLVRFVANDKGLEELVPLLEGPTGLAFVESDAAQVAKAIREFSRDNPELVIKGGVLGDSVIGVKDITALAELPPREVLLAKIAGVLAAPMQEFAGLLKAVPQSFAYALSALVAKGGSGEASPSEEPAAEAKAEPATEAPYEEPAAEAKAEPATEAPSEEPAAEAKAEPATEAPSEDPAAEDEEPQAEG